MNCLIFILVFAQYTLLKSEELDPVVDTPLGKIRGNVMVSRKGEPYLAFRGIRYAQPPVDDLRFQVVSIIISKLLHLNSF